MLPLLAVAETPHGPRHDNKGAAIQTNTVEAAKATAAESLTVMPGFKVELIRSAEIGEGSWICIPSVRDRAIVAFHAFALWPGEESRADSCSRASCDGTALRP